MVPLITAGAKFLVKRKLISKIMDWLPKILAFFVTLSLLFSSFLPSYLKTYSKMSSEGNECITYPLIKDYPITSYHGYRGYVAGVPMVGTWHDGVDYGSPIGTPMLAIINGTIQHDENYCGLGIWINGMNPNGEKIRARYWHISGRIAPNGSNVKKGEVIGLSGNSGACTNGPHLHLEFWINGKPVDPLKYRCQQ